MKVKDSGAKNSIYDLKKGDVFKIKKKIWFIDMENKPIRYVEAKEKLTYLRKASNFNSNIKKWLVCKDKNGVEGMLNPNGMINNFKIIEK